MQKITNRKPMKPSIKNAHIDDEEHKKEVTKLKQKQDHLNHIHGYRHISVHGTKEQKISLQKEVAVHAQMQGLMKEQVKLSEKKQELVEVERMAQHLEQMRKQDADRERMRKLEIQKIQEYNRQMADERKTKQERDRNTENLKQKEVIEEGACHNKNVWIR